MKNRIIWCLVFCAIVIVIIIAINRARFSSNVDETSYPFSKQIRYSFELQNTSNKLLRNVNFLAYAPVKQTATQLSGKIETSYPHQIISDQLGNQILEFSFAQFPPFATRIVSIKADLLMAENPTRISNIEMAGFSGPEKLIESGHPDIIRQATSFKDENTYKTAKKIFSWVSEHIKYQGYINEDRGALYALSNRKGDCTEYMALFIALCRANKIPARGVAGYVCAENTFLKQSGLHNWAEFFDGKIWRIADPQNKIFSDKNRDYVAMRIISGENKKPMMGFNRFRIQDQNIDVRMN